MIKNEIKKCPVIQDNVGEYDTKNEIKQGSF